MPALDERKIMEMEFNLRLQKLENAKASKKRKMKLPDLFSSADATSVKKRLKGKTSLQVGTPTVNPDTPASR